MESWCRICSRSDEFRRFPLFSVADVSQEVIAKMITSCTDTLVSSEDGLPQQICPDCLITLSLAYSFRRLCRRTDAKFRETFDPRAPAEHMATGGSQPRRSQSQVGLDESGGGGGVVYDSVPVIKEEVEFYEYECSAPPPPPPEDQWVIQNPRTIHEATAGAMTVLHNPGGQYQEEGGGVGEQPDVDDMMSSMVPMVTMEEGGGGLDPSEYGECSGSGQRKKKHEPERFSKRIRRQESPALHDGTAGADPSHFLVAMPDPAGNGLLEEIITSDGQQLVINPAKQLQRCQYCRKKMKKPYKHRNGKCMETKKMPARPRCPYCHIVFVRSSSIPLHVQNSCRVYRELCATSQELPDPNEPVEELETEEVVPPQPPTVKVKNNSKTVDVKPILQKSKPKSSLICRYCYMSFGKRATLIKHQRDRCRVLNELDVERLTSNLAALETSIADTTTTAQEPEPEPEREKVQDDDDTEETTCVYCTQLVSRKTRFQHHNGRCVLGRANADHPCPYCDSAYASRSNLLRHQREHCQKYREEHNTDITLTNAFQGLPVEGDTSLDETGPKTVADASPAAKPERKPKPPKEEVVYVVKRKKLKQVTTPTTTKPTKRTPPEPANFVCSYCRKGFALRDTLIEHQRSCTARKLHKQVKCQFCGMVISNRGNLRKHQKLYCKHVPREDAPKLEHSEDEQETVPELKKPKIVKPLKKVKKEKASNGPPAEVDQSTKEDPPPEEIAPPASDDEPVLKRRPGRPGKHNNIPCPHCDKTFQNHRQLRNHVRICAKSRKMYKCKYCPAEFTHPSNMSRHIRLKRCTAVNTLNETVENGFQSDSCNLLSSTVHEPDPLGEPTADEDFEMILPDSSQEQPIRPDLAENNNATQREVKEPDVPEAEDALTVHPEAVLFSEEVELQQEQPPAAEVVQPELPAATLGAEQEQAGQ
uniref:Zinc finger protein 263 n=1 Tax=Culex pipiens TaxID=7175 RepID=A0A8D8JXB7_CULPI